MIDRYGLGEDENEDDIDAEVMRATEHYLYSHCEAWKQHYDEVVLSRQIKLDAATRKSLSELEHDIATLKDQFRVGGPRAAEIVNALKKVIAPVGKEASKEGRQKKLSAANKVFDIIVGKLTPPLSNQEMKVVALLKEHVSSHPFDEIPISLVQLARKAGAALQKQKDKAEIASILLAKLPSEVQEKIKSNNDVLTLSAGFKSVIVVDRVEVGAERERIWLLRKNFPKNSPEVMYVREQCISNPSDKNDLADQLSRSPSDRTAVLCSIGVDKQLTKSSILSQAAKETTVRATRRTG